MEPGSVEDFAVGALLVTAMSFGIVLISAMIFRRFIALKSKPDRRALWSVLPGFLISASLVVPMLNEMGGLILAPLVAVGTGWIVFWMFRRDFRKAWIADPSLPISVDAPLSEVIDITARILGKHVRDVTVMKPDAIEPSCSCHLDRIGDRVTAPAPADPSAARPSVSSACRCDKSRSPARRQRDVRSRAVLRL